MKKWSFVLAVMFALNTASYAETGIYEENVGVSDVTLRDGRAWLRFVKAGTISWCLSDSAYWPTAGGYHAFIDMNGASAQQYLSMAIAAKTTGSPVRVWVGGTAVVNNGVTTLVPVRCNEESKFFTLKVIGFGLSRGI